MAVKTTAESGRKDISLFHIKSRQNCGNNRRIICCAAGFRQPAEKGHKGCSQRHSGHDQSKGQYYRAALQKAYGRAQFPRSKLPNLLYIMIMPSKRGSNTESAKKEIKPSYAACFLLLNKISMLTAAIESSSKMKRIIKSEKKNNPISRP